MNNTSALRERVEELEEEIRQLRAELTSQSALPIAGLTQTENLIVGLLETGRVVRLDTVNLARAGTQCVPMETKALQVHIYNIRRKTKMPIETVWGRGYRLARNIPVEVPIS